MEWITETLHTPIRDRYDVIVAGGGTAGVVAALAAARNGARTALIERFNFLGGSMIEGAGPLHSFFNVFKPFGVEKVQLVRGIPQEIIDRMTAVGGSPGHLEQDMGGSYDSVITAIDWEIFKEVILEMLQESGVEIYLHTTVAGAIMDGNTVKGVIIQSKSGREALCCGTVVDTTGDGDVAAYAGADFIKCHQKHGVGYPFGMANVDLPRLMRYCEEKGIVRQQVLLDKGEGTDPDKDCYFRIGFQFDRLEPLREYMVKNGMWGPLGLAYHLRDYNYMNGAALQDVDSTDARAVTDAEIQLRRQVMEFAQLLKAHIPGFEKAYVYRTPVHIGVRYSRVIECEYDISNEEIVNCARFDDEIMLYGFHDSAPRIMIKNGGWYGLPYRALIPKKIDSLLVAGRLITSEHEAHMSTRNTVSCMAQGQAAGTAAALCLKEGVPPRRLDMKKLRDTLREQGVYLER